MAPLSRRALDETAAWLVTSAGRVNFGTGRLSTGVWGAGWGETVIAATIDAVMAAASATARPIFTRRRGGGLRPRRRSDEGSGPGPANSPDLCRPTVTSRPRCSRYRPSSAGADRPLGPTIPRYLLLTTYSSLPTPRWG